VQQDSESLNFEWMLSVVRRRLPLIVLCFVVVAAAAYLYSKQQTKMYTATASLVFSNNNLSQELVGLPSSSSNLLVQEAGNLESVKLGDMAAKTAMLLGHGLTEERVKASVKVGGLGESSSVAVSATAASPVLAAGIANTYVTQFVAEQGYASRRFFKSALALVDKQLATLSRQQRLGPSGVALQNRAQSLRFLSELQGGGVSVAQQASVPTSPSSPKTSRNTVLGGILGLLIGLGLVVLLERIDRRRRITEPTDLEAIYGPALLGAVPKSARLSRPGSGRGDTALSSSEAETFHLIRAHLRSFNADSDLRTIVVASPAAGEGRTVIARHLAEAAARLGSRVLLLEADLRRPALARRLDLQPQAFLPDVLIGIASMEAAICSIELQAPFGEGLEHRTLDVLLAGIEPPRNPGALMESHTMDTVLEQARSTYDLVVVDTPPLAEFSDAFPLLQKVDGAIIVGRIGYSRRDTAERLHKVLDGSGVPLLGVIANEAKSIGRPSRGYEPKSATPAQTSPSARPPRDSDPSEDLVSSTTNV
jgi:capsular exopolysaccharide synthesis family protein